MIETSCAEKRERGTKMKSIKRLAAAVLAFVMLFTAAVGMTTAAAEGAAIPGAAAKTAPTLDEALNIAGGTLHFEPYMPGEVVWPEWTVQTGSEPGHEAYAMSSTEDSTYLCLKNVELGGNETLQLDYKWFFMYNGTSNLQVEFGPAGDPYNMFALTVESPVNQYDGTWHAGNVDLAEALELMGWEPGSYDININFSKNGDDTSYACIDNIRLGERVSVTGVSVEDAELYVGTSRKLTCVVSPVEATNKKVVFESDDWSVAEINYETGVVTGIAPGTTTVTVTTEDGGFTDSCTVTVSELGEITFYGNSISSSSGTYAGNWISFTNRSLETEAANLGPALPTGYAAEYVGGVIYGYALTEGGMQLYTCTLDNLSPVPHGVPNNRKYVMDMAYNYADGTMYALNVHSHLVGVQTVKRFLCKVDIVSGKLYDEKLIDCGDGVEAVALAISADGAAYVMDNLGQLRTLNLETGTTNAIGWSGLNTSSHVQSMAFDHDTNTLYWANVMDDQSAFYLIDTVTGAGTCLGMIGGNPTEISGLFTVSESVSAEPPTPRAVTVAFVDEVTGETLGTAEKLQCEQMTAEDYPEAPAHKGFEFRRWSVEAGDEVYEDTVVKAKYTRLRHEGDAAVILRAADVWGNGGGYQMLLDADHNTYYYDGFADPDDLGETQVIPPFGGFTEFGDADPADYELFENTLPFDADGRCSTENIICDDMMKIYIPAGVYDWCITNPTPGDRIWIASNDGSCRGREDDFEFEAGKTYVFDVKFENNGDRVDLTVYDDEQYVVRFIDGATGETIGTQLVAGGSAAELPELPVHEGWFSFGWNADVSCVTEDMTVTALFALPGDLDMSGTVDISDAILILRHAMGAGELTEMQLVLADIDNSGDVSAVDALTVLRRAMGI